MFNAAFQAAVASYRYCRSQQAWVAEEQMTAEIAPGMKRRPKPRRRQTQAK